MKNYENQWYGGVGLFGENYENHMAWYKSDHTKYDMCENNSLLGLY